MWTMIENSKLERYLNQYSFLVEHLNDISLYSNEKYTFLPRRFYTTYSSPSLIFHKDKSWIPKQIPTLQFSPNERLKPDQIKTCKDITNLINSDQYVGIIKARPGAGKTVMSINISCSTKKKTLIILDNGNLVNQWVESICKFATVNGKPITEDQIGIIKGDIFTTTSDTPFTIAMVQTLVSRVKRDMINFYKKIAEQGFDLVFYDECHKTTCGPKFATASLLINTKNIIGLSATPFVDNLQEILLGNTIGQIVTENSVYDLTPTINYVLYDSCLTHQYGWFVSKAQDMIRQRARYISKLSESIEYKNIIVKLVKEMLGNGHTIIIIVFTVELVKTISDWLTRESIQNRQFYSKQTDIDKENDRVIIATYGYAGAGFDFKALSAAIIATPLSGKKSLIQVIGRILRDLSGKENPVVYDLVDTGFDGLFSRDIDKKSAILTNEFKCKINHVNM